MTKGTITLGRWKSGLIVCVWQSQLKPLHLLRALLSKAWKTGFSTKEYLIAFDIISSNHKRWDRPSLRSALCLMFLLGSFRKKLADWNSSTPPIRTKLPRILHAWGKSRKLKEFLAEYHLPPFLNIALNKEVIKMRVVHTGDRSAIPAKKVRSPSSVGTKSRSKLRSDKFGILGPIHPPRTLDGEISIFIKELSLFLGIKVATPPLIESRIKPSDESDKALDEILKDIKPYVSLYEKEK